MKQSVCQLCHSHLCPVLTFVICVGLLHISLSFTAFYFPIIYLSTSLFLTLAVAALLYLATFTKPILLQLLLHLNRYFSSNLYLYLYSNLYVTYAYVLNVNLPLFLFLTTLFIVSLSLCVMHSYCLFFIIALMYLPSLCHSLFLSFFQIVFICHHILLILVSSLQTASNKHQKCQTIAAATIFTLKIDSRN